MVRKSEALQKFSAKVVSRHLDSLIQLGEDGVELLSTRLTTMHDQDVIATTKLAYEIASLFDAKLQQLQAENPNLTCEDLGISVNTLEAKFSEID